ncbi:predicted protein [Nematostella vectensis]|uniref:Ig-like domain-containing protein n=1 Tax=Nematostella vectensis TaxID=45351 RepID=A7RHA3_NEMVE|nr:predicted protein [Nematostella vectensis]|eukprot:XP_001641253.1 predicted protein [Nematostella vectensis]
MFSQGARRFTGGVLLAALLALITERSTAEPTCSVPMFRGAPANSTIQAAGTDVKLVCQVLDQKDVFTDYIWYKDGKKMSVSHSSRMRIKRLRYLKIKNLDKEDSGRYTCVAKRPCGEISANITLTVDCNPNLASRESNQSSPDVHGQQVETRKDPDSNACWKLPKTRLLRRR